MFLFFVIILVVVYLFFQISKRGIESSLSKNSFNFIIVLLILSVGFRGEGVDNDYGTYLKAMDDGLMTIGEPTFLLISSIIKIIGIPNVFLFVIYAFIGIFLKTYIIYHYSAYPNVSIIIYLSNIFLLQDVNQIRAGAATAIFLFSIPFLMRGDRGKFIILIFVASLFHFSALLYLVVLFIDEKDFTYRSYLFWAMTPLLGYVCFYLFSNLSLENIPIAPIREKILMYKRLQEAGEDGFSHINLFNPYFLFKLFVYYFLLEYYWLLKRKCVNIALYMKIFAISLFVFPTLGAITPILGYRSSDLFASIEIFLFPYLFTLFDKNCRVYSLCLYFALLFTINIFYKHLIYI